MSAAEWAQLLSTVEAKQRPLFDPHFLEQRAFIEDESKLICLLCTRRAGKSYGAGLRLIRAAQRNPGASCLFIALTRDSAEKILWKDVLKVINREWKLGAVFNESKLRMTLPNGSVIYLLGADADETERQKLLGQKYAEVCIDEGASYSIDLRHLVYAILKPAVADYRGVISLIGTPGNLKTGLFFELTQGQDPRQPGTWTTLGWKGHRWSAFQNPHMRQKWEEEIAELIAGNPLIVETPIFQQHYYGVWVIDTDALVYRYAEGRNDFISLPVVNGAGGWHWVLAIDLGFNDACAFTVLAYHDDLRCLFVLSSHKKTQLDITATAEEAARIKRIYPVDVTVIDGANKQAVAELNNRHGMEAVPADKREKAEFIDIMNGEFIMGLIKLGPDAQALKDEYKALVWDEKALTRRKREEHPNCANHSADTALYGWRWCYQWLWVEPEKSKPKRGTPEAAAAEVIEQQQQQDEYWDEVAAANRHRREEDQSGWL